MNSILTIHLIFNGLDYSIIVYSDATLDQIIEQLNIIPETDHYLVAFKQEIQIMPLFSLFFQNIHDDDVIILEQRRINQNQKGCNKVLDEILNRLNDEEEGPDEFYLEAARLADLGFSQWETSSKLPFILKEMYEDSINDKEASENHQIVCKTTTIKAQKVSDQPLPVFFSFDD